MTKSLKILPQNFCTGKQQCCLGEISTSHDHLQAKLGPPQHVEMLSGDNKVTTSWYVQFGDDVFEIFDYKASVLYGEGGLNLHLAQIRSDQELVWSIGGDPETDPQEFIDFLMGQ